MPWMSPVNRSGTVADSLGSLCSARSDTLHKTRNYRKLVYGVRILRKSPCAYRNCRTKRKAGHRPWSNTCQVGYVWISQGKAHRDEVENSLLVDHSWEQQEYLGNDPQYTGHKCAAQAHRDTSQDRHLQGSKWCSNITGPLRGEVWTSHNYRLLPEMTS